MRHPSLPIPTSLWRWVLLAILGVLLLALPDDGAGLLLLQGDAHLAATEYAQALAFYQQAANREPENAAVYLRLGRLHLAKGRYVQAEAALSKGAEVLGCWGAPHLLGSSAPLPPCPPAPLLALGDVYAQTQRPALAAAAYRLAVACGEPEARYPLALTYLRLDRLQPAQQELAILSHEGHQRASLTLGLLLALDDPAAARSTLQLAQHGPDPALAAAATQALADLTLIPPAPFPLPLEERGKGVQGEGGEDAYAALLVGRTALRLALPEVARAAFGQAARRNPLYAQAHAYLGYSLYLLGDHDAASASLAQAQTLAPADPLPHHFLGLVYRAQGQPERALAELEIALSLDPGNPALLADAGETYAAQKNYLQAQEDLTAAVRADPSSPVPWLRLARFHLDYLFKVEDGLAAAQQAARLAPNSGEALDALGWALHLNQRPQEALPALRHAVELSPGSARAQYHLGVVAAQAGEITMARRAYQRAIDLDTTGFDEARAQKALEGLEGRGDRR